MLHIAEGGLARFDGYHLKVFDRPNTPGMVGDHIRAAVFHEKGCEHCYGVDGIPTDKGFDLSGVTKARPQT